MEHLPWVALDAIVPGPALILAPHADDESLGCGGMIAAACARGRVPAIVVISDGTGSHPGSASYPAARLKSVREAEAIAAAGILGVPRDRMHFLGLPDTRVPHRGPDFEQAVRRIVELAQRHEATTICATWRHDPHGDHEATHWLGSAAARIAGIRLLSYPVWGWLLPPERALPVTALAGARLDIAAYQLLKQRAIVAHASQYSDLIADDPGGFRLPAELLAVFQRPYEVFLATP